MTNFNDITDIGELKALLHSGKLPKYIADRVERRIRKLKKGIRPSANLLYKEITFINDVDYLKELLYNEETNESPRHSIIYRLNSRIRRLQK